MIMKKWLSGILALFSGTLFLAAAEKPNVIYIMADDLGIGDVGCYGQKILKTPRIDQLAEEGIRFTEHYSGAALCAPTRSCLLTGTHLGHTTVRNNGDFSLKIEDVTFGELMKSVGYKTAAIGKWGVGEIDSTGRPNKQGFDLFFGYLNQRNAHFHYPPFMWRNEEKEFYPDNREKRTHFSHDLFTEEALKFVRDNKDGPFCLYVPYTLVHADIDVPDDSLKPWVGNIEETEPYGTPDGQHYIHQKTPHAAFAGMVSRLDRDVGKIADLVDELGIAENTLIIFTSDNGPTPAGGADPEFFDGNGLYRGIKFSLYDGGIRCPMIARWPGTIEAGSESKHLSAHWDVLPTMAEVAGAKVPEGVDGVSFLPELKGEAEKQKAHDYLYWEWPSKSGWQAVRQGNWKAHWTGTRSGLRNATFELYDLSKDIAEENNVAAKFPEVAAKMKKLMDEAHIPEHDGADPLFTRASSKKKKK